MNTLVAVLTGWLNNWMGSKRDERAHARERLAAREALGQQRLDRTYTELGIFLSHWADWARSVRPFMGEVPAPDPMPDEERWRIETLVTNHGSPEVRRLLDQWGEQRLKIQEADIVIRMAERSRDPGSLGEKADQEHMALEDYRRAMHQAAEAIRDQMRKELAGQAEPPTSSALARKERRRGILGRRRSSRAGTPDVGP